MSISGSTISGSIFLDLNADGLFDGSDSGIGGQTVQLLNSNGAVVATTATLSDGTYSFTGVTAGSYSVQASPPSGDHFSPAATGYTGPNAASVVDATGKTPAITVSAGVNAAHQNAGVYAPVTYSGTVFTDNNDNGLVDGTDTGKAGVTVQLLGANGAPTGQTAITAANGTYSFTNLTPGVYSAQVVLPSLPPGAQFSPMGSNTTPQPTGGPVTAAQNLLTNGSFEPASAFTTAQGFAGWTESANTASTPFGGGPGHGVELALTNASNATAIDPTGATNPYAGTVAPDNANPNYLGGSGTHAAFFVDDGAIETLSQTVTLQAGQTYEVGFDLDETTPGQNNPGFFQLAAAVNGQTIVTAGSTSGTILKAGTWTHFADLYTATASGSTTLTFTYQSGVPGSTLASKDVLVDDVYIVPGQVTTTLTTTSEVNANGLTTPVTLTSGQSVGNESAGIYFPPATISGTVFADTNADGIREAVDAGLAGRTVDLTSNGTVVATAVTDASGNYSFTNQAAGTYTVTVVAPSGGKFSAAGASTTLPDSTVSTSGTKTVTVASGGTATVNAGIYNTGAISGTVFADANGDGAKQSTDAGLSGQTVILQNASGAAVATTSTNASGAYSFTGQIPGNYNVQVTPPAGDAVSQPGISTTLTDSTVNASAAQTVQLTSGGAVSVNAGLYVPATVSGAVFADANADGAQQSGDAGLAGVKVQLTGSTGVVLATTTTAANGSYSFTGIAPGTDTLQVIAPANDTVSPMGASATLPDSTVNASGSSTVTLISGSNATVNAGLYAPGTVSGTVFSDANGDGAQQAGDAGLGGQTVNLRGPSGTVLATAVTAANGSYSFAGVTPGADTVQVVAASGATFSPTGSSAALPDSGVSSMGTAPATVTSGSNATVNAGEFVPSTISGTVFTDTNADGVKQTTDAGLAGQTVKLLNASGGVLATAMTAANGSYSFTGVAPGTDTVVVAAPAGDVFSAPGTSTALPDSGVSSTGVSSVTVTSGSSSVVNAGVFAPATVTGTIFTDANGDGAMQASDAGVSGQTVTLVAPNGTVAASTVTGSNGGYNFTGVTPGSYTVQTAAPAGDVFSPAGGSATLPDSSVSSTGGAPVTLTSGATATVNAGEFAPSTISGTVFTDVNADGVKQAGDAGLGGQTVNLLSATGAVIASTTTAANGSYSFTGIAPGNDTVQVIAPPGSSVSPPGGSTTLPDSTVTAAGTQAVTVTSGSSATVNAGVFAPASIGGTVFNDLNGDGVKGSGDAGLGGQTVTLLNGAGTAVATATTNANGGYSFGGLTPATYTVQVTPAAGDGFSTPSSQTVTLTSGASATVNAGEFAPGTVAGTVFDDANADGAQQPAETGLSGVTVDLVGADGSLVAATVTAADGSYSFAGLRPGATDTVQVVAPAGERFSPAGTNASLPDSTVSATGTQAVTLTAGAALQANAGLYAPASVAGTVFLDAHYDGLDDLGDPAFSGVTVKLYDAGGFTGQTTTTDAAGHYSFAGLTPGAYQVQFVAPTGTTFAQAHIGSNAALNSDADPATGFSSAFTLTEGQTDTAHNAGLTLTGGFANGDAQSGSGRLFGGAGDNIIIGAPGSNTIEGGSGTNLIFGGSGPFAQIQGLGTNDIIYGGNGDDLIQGHAGDSFIAAGIGNQTLDGGGGTNTFIANANSGTITDTNGVFTGISGGDTFVTHGTTASIYQAGDGLLTIEDYDASAGDTLQVYGYTAPTAVGQANGFDVLYFGANAAILVRANNTTVSANGMIQGVSFSPNAPAAPLSTVSVTASNNLTYTLAGAAAPLIGPGAAPVQQAAPFTQDGSFGRVGSAVGTSQTVVSATASASSGAITLDGWNNTVTVGDGNSTVNAGNGNATVVAGNGNDVITAGGYSNVITVGTGDDHINAGSGATVTAAGGDQTVTLGGYGNLVFLNGTGVSTVGGGMGDDQIATAGGSATITLGGWGNTVTTGGANDTIADGAGTTQFIVGPTQSGLSGGAEIITGFQASDVVTLVNGAAGGQTAAQLFGDLTASGGNTVLNLGAAGSVTFAGLTPGQLQVANFAVGHGN